jgi:hypothetical protein
VHVRSDLANRQRDIRVRRVLAIRDHQSRVWRDQALVGRAAVVLTGDDGQIVRHETSCLRRVRLDNVVRNLGSFEALDEADRHRIVLGDDYVP